MNSIHTLRRFGLILLSALFALYVEAALAQGGLPSATPTPDAPPAADAFDASVYQWTPIAGRFDLPVGITNAGDGSGRLFVLEQAGYIWVIEGEKQLETPFLDIRDLVPDDTFRGGYTERGLLVPVVRNADQKSLHQIGSDLRELVDRARKSRSVPDDFGGTFTITSLGPMDVDGFTPIINTPEAAILGVGRIADKAVVYKGQLAARKMMVLSLAFDHRITDGAPAARFLKYVKELIEEPYLLLAE